MARRKPEITELPTRLLLVELGSEKRWTKVALWGGLGLGVVGAAVYAAVFAFQSSSDADRQKAWDGLNTCLLGEPLAEGETASSRVRALQLGAVGVPIDRRSKPGEAAWPSSCASFAADLGRSAGGAGQKTLEEAAAGLAKTLKDDSSAAGDHGAGIDKVWKEAGAVKLVAAPSTTAPKPPEVGRPVFTTDGWAKLARLGSANMTLSNVFVPESRAGKTFFLVDQKDIPEGPALCNMKEGAVRCIKLPAAVAALSPGLRLVGTTDDGARPFYFAGDRGQLGVFPPEGGDKVATKVALGASAQADGSLYLLTREDKELRLLTRPPQGAGSERTIAAGKLGDATQSGLAWDWLVYRTKDGKLSAQKLGAGGKDAGAVIEIGDVDAPTLGEKEAYATACRTDEGLALRARGASSDWMAFHAGGRWSAPVKAPVRGGALTCQGVEATVTAVDHAPDGGRDYATITQARCNGAGCKAVSVGFRQLLPGLAEIVPADAQNVAAVDVGGKLLLVWNAGHLGGLRFRLAPIDRIKDTPDTVIADGRDDKVGAKLSSIVEVRALTAGKGALLLVGTTTGVVALEVDGAGKITPLGGGS
jgi:hypothetical protein